MLSVSCDNMHVASGDQSGQVSVEIYFLISEENNHGKFGMKHGRALGLDIYCPVRPLWSALADHGLISEFSFKKSLIFGLILVKITTF